MLFVVYVSLEKQVSELFNVLLKRIVTKKDTTREVLDRRKIFDLITMKNVSYVDV